MSLSAKVTKDIKHATRHPCFVLIYWMPLCVHSILKRPEVCGCSNSSLQHSSFPCWAQWIDPNSFVHTGLCTCQVILITACHQATTRDQNHFNQQTSASTAVDLLLSQSHYSSAVTWIWNKWLLLLFEGLPTIPSTSKWFWRMAKVKTIYMCCHTKVWATDQTCCSTQSQYTDTWSTSPCTNLLMPVSWQSSH